MQALSVTKKKRNASSKVDSSRVLGGFESIPPLERGERRGERVQRIRAHVCRAFGRSWSPALIDRAAKIQRCGSAWVAQLCTADPSRSRAVPVDRCKDRYCPNCARVRARYYAERVEAYMQEVTRRGRRPKMLVLTVRTLAGEGVGVVRKKLYASFSKLRRVKEWKKHVIGGIAFEECTTSADADGLLRFHVHLHVILDAVYWPQHEISAAWSRATSGESSVVWIGAIRSPREVAKYVTTPEAMPEEGLVEYALATTGRRLVRSFGDAYGVTMSEASAWSRVDAVDADKFSRCSLWRLWVDALTAPGMVEHARAVAWSLLVHGARDSIPGHVFALLSPSSTIKAEST